jgi:hypothetical protein
LTRLRTRPDDSPVVPRYFTLEEANEALAEVRPLAERIVAERQELARIQTRRAQLHAIVAGNGGGVAPSEPGELASAAEEHGAVIARCLERIQAIGAQVKDLDTGLIDFPTLRDGEEALLCWQVGEDEIGWWHGTDEGFAGRRPL